jgi:hypothetical protein
MKRKELSPGVRARAQKLGIDSLEAIVRWEESHGKGGAYKRWSGPVFSIPDGFTRDYAALVN